MRAITEEEVALLADLVAIPSLSGDETAAVEHVECWCRSQGLPACVDRTGVLIELHGRAPGPTLALASHLDVVPAGDGWTRAPFDARIEGGFLYGRGSGDAKASVTSMLLAARDTARAGGPARGRLLVLLTLGEESRNPSMPDALERAGPIDAAVIGEPTGLDLAVAQRGLVIAELRASGEQRHAGHAPRSHSQGAIEILAADILELGGLFASRSHPILGRTTVTPTMLSAGISRNVTPSEAMATLDVRTTPDWTHDEVVRELRSALRSEVRVVSDRLVPCRTPEGSRLLERARAIRPSSRTYASPTCSDWVFLKDADAVKCGPGESDLSHRPDECVSLQHLFEARGFYTALAREYLA
jgi:acetylornithine deacetylase